MIIKSSVLIEEFVKDKRNRGKLSILATMGSGTDSISLGSTVGSDSRLRKRRELVIFQTLIASSPDAKILSFIFFKKRPNHKSTARLKGLKRNVMSG